MYEGRTERAGGKDRLAVSSMRLQSVTGKTGRETDTGYIRQEFLMNSRLRYPLALHWWCKARSASLPVFQ